MTTDTFNLNTDLIFHDPDGQMITVELTELSLDILEKALANCRLTFSIPHSLYLYLAETEAFNNRLDFRSDGWQRGFTSDRPVEMEVKLAPDLLSRLFRHAQTAETATDYLSELPLEDDLLFSESWFTMYVKQAVPVPPEFGNATLKEGYSSEWANF